MVNPGNTVGGSKSRGALVAIETLVALWWTEKQSFLDNRTRTPVVWRRGVHPSDALKWEGRSCYCCIRSGCPIYCSVEFIFCSMPPSLRTPRSVVYFPRRRNPRCFNVFPGMCSEWTDGAAVEKGNSRRSCCIGKSSSRPRAPSYQTLARQFNLADRLPMLVASLACADRNSFAEFDLVFHVRMWTGAVMREMDAGQGIGAKIV